MAGSRSASCSTRCGPTRSRASSRSARTRASSCSSGSTGTATASSRGKSSWPSSARSRPGGPARRAPIPSAGRAELSAVDVDLSAQRMAVEVTLSQPPRLRVVDAATPSQAATGARRAVFLVDADALVRARGSVRPLAERLAPCGETPPTRSTSRSRAPCDRRRAREPAGGSPAARRHDALEAGVARHGEVSSARRTPRSARRPGVATRRRRRGKP